MTTDNDFWKKKELSEMTDTEWESICDGCGMCCLHKLQDEESGEIYITSISCQLLNTENCSCNDYEERFKKVPMCTRVTPDNIDTLVWLPDTCAYRRLYKGEPLPDWHPLVSGNKYTVYEAGMSACQFAQSEEYIHPEQWQDWIIRKVGQD